MPLGSPKRAHNQTQLLNKFYSDERFGDRIDLKLDDDLQAIKAIKAALAINHFRTNDNRTDPGK